MRIKKGRLTFFLLDKVNQNADAADRTDGHRLEGAIPALSVVDVEEKYRKLAEHYWGMYLLPIVKMPYKTAMGL
ncbi:MAG: hypothetical protein WDO16_16580 [Bacteroidota bacterium]